MASIEQEKKYEHDKYIPLNLIHDILLCATVKDLGRWKSVSKAWLELISSPEFVLNHCEKSKVSLILETSCRNFNKYIDGSSRTSEKPLDPSRGSCPNASIMGSCNGLICFLMKDICIYRRQTVFIFNPSTEKSFSLPVDDSRIILYWFGRGPSSICRNLDQYMIVIASRGSPSINHSWPLELKVGKLKLVVGSKKPQFLWDDPLIFREGFIAPIDETGISLQNFIHWRVTVRFGNDGHYLQRIFRYHLENKRMDYISLPDAYNKDQWFCSLGVLNESLIILLKNNDDIFELWIMQEYGVGKSWTKHHIFRGFDEYRYLYPLEFSADGCLFVRAISMDNVRRTRENKIAKYDFTRETITDLHQGSSNSIWIMFSGSLVG